MTTADLALKIVETPASGTKNATWLRLIANAIKRGRRPTGGSQVTTWLELHNQGASPLNRDWRLYFSLGLTPVDDKLVRQHLIDGRYGFLEPGDGWQPLAPGSRRRIQVRNWLFSGMNLVARQGFFLVRLDGQGREQVPVEPDCLPPELQPLTAVRNPSISAMSADVRTRENPAPASTDARLTVIPAPKYAGFPAARAASPSSRADPAIAAPVIDSTLADSYQIEITGANISMTARSPADAFYARQTLEQLLANHQTPPAGSIRDSADFDYRGLFIDISRHFHDGAQLKKIVRAMSRYKMNRLQLGLSNDEGWRLEIKDLPELTETGARRGPPGPIFPCWGDGPQEVSGFLTRAEFIDLLRFAAERHVTVIPEFNLPGHANALLRSLDASGDWQLADPDDTSAYRSAQGYTRNVLNPGLADSYRLAGKIIADIRAIYDAAGVRLTHLHLGGDEVPEGAWLHSPACQALPVWDARWNPDRREDQQSARAALMGYHYQRMLEVLGEASPGTLPGFWHEMAPHGDDRSYYTVWLTDQGDHSALDHILKHQFPFVIANASHLYLDMPYAMSATEPGLPWANYVDMENIYHFDPLATWKLSGKEQVMGIQAQLWTETVFTGELMDYYLFPRLLAVAERGWNNTPEPGQWRDFYSAVSQREYARLLDIGVTPRPLPGN